MFGSKFTKFLSFLKQQISFYSNCASLFSVMRHNSSKLFLRTFYILSTKGAYQKETCRFKHEEFCGFSLNHHQKSRNFTSIGLFCPQYMSFERKIYRGLIFHETEQWCKIWINPDPVVSKMAWGVGWTFIRALGSYCQKHMFQLENFRVIMCHDTEGWCKILIKTISWLEKWHKEFC